MRAITGPAVLAMEDPHQPGEPDHDARVVRLNDRPVAPALARFVMDSLATEVILATAAGVDIHVLRRQP